MYRSCAAHPVVWPLFTLIAEGKTALAVGAVSNLGVCPQAEMGWLCVQAHCTVSSWFWRSTGSDAGAE